MGVEGIMFRINRCKECGTEWKVRTTVIADRSLEKCPDCGHSEGDTNTSARREFQRSDAYRFARGNRRYD